MRRSSRGVRRSSRFRRPLSFATARSVAGVPELVASLEQPLQLTGASASVALSFNSRATGAAVASIGGAPRALLEIDSITAEGRPGTVYGVYVDLPAGASAEQEAASHVGSLSFFGLERAQNPRGDHNVLWSSRKRCKPTRVRFTACGLVASSTVGATFAGSMPWIAPSPLASRARLRGSRR
jgi:hypothetical protein